MEWISFLTPVRWLIVSEASHARDESDGWIDPLPAQMMSENFISWLSMINNGTGTISGLRDERLMVDGDVVVVVALLL